MPPEVHPATRTYYSIRDQDAMRGYRAIPDAEVSRGMRRKVAAFEYAERLVREKVESGGE